VARWRFAAEPVEVGRARNAVARQLARWGLDALVDHARVMVSELVTNAVRHAHGRHIGLRLVRSSTLTCEVEDEDHTLPTLLEADCGDEYGRGLRVVSSLAREWGTSGTGTGKTVWFELPLPRG
jgi:anti-sigma regulatory factor (Ser/Thr protein kinase)